MGMDVIGLEPTTPEGETFRRNIWGWRPLAEMVCTLEPELTSACTHWQSNDGDGLDAQTSKELSDALQRDIAAGRVERLVIARDKRVAALPPRSCNQCDGTGSNQPLEAWYHASVEDVAEFATFLATCGGFEIC